MASALWNGNDNTLMKRIEGGRWGEFVPAVSLYLDDVEMIIEDLRRGGLQVRFSDAEYEFADLDECIEVRGVSPSSLNIDATAEGFSAVSLHIKRWFPYGALWLYASSEASQQVAFRIRELLDRRRRWSTQLLVPRFWWGVAVLIVVVELIGLIPRLRTTINPLLLPLLAFPAVGVALFSGLVSRGFGSRINLAHKHAATTIWSRNREKVIFGAIGGAIGAVLSAIATVLVQRLMAAHP
jgi:hypothetical protein